MTPGPRTRDTLLRGERSHPCGIPPTLLNIVFSGPHAEYSYFSADFSLKMVVNILRFA